jgi:hypothetical protein
MTNDEIVDDLINWVALSKGLTGKPQNIRKDTIPKKYAGAVARLRSTMKNWLIYTDMYSEFKK